jgi:hypothetical protein
MVPSLPVVDAGHPADGRGARRLGADNVKMIPSTCSLSGVISAVITPNGISPGLLSACAIGRVTAMAPKARASALVPAEEAAGMEAHVSSF